MTFHRLIYTVKKSVGEGELLKSTTLGLTSYLDGLRWLKNNPRYLPVLFVPMVITVIILISLVATFFVFGKELIGSWIPLDSSWFLALLYYLVGGILVVILPFLPLVMISNLLSSPFYEIVSCAVERQIRGTVVEISWGRMLLALIEEGKKVAFITLVNLLMFLLAFIPIFSPLLFVLVPLINVFLFGWEFCDYPLARRGWNFKSRLRFAVKNFFPLTGFGLWMLIPLHFIILPLAVAGSTKLTLKLSPEK